jgi:hypothetical protein
MQEFLDLFAAAIADDEHVAMVLDQAGWHGSGALRIPDSITLVPLPPAMPGTASAPKQGELLHYALTLGYPRSKVRLAGISGRIAALPRLCRWADSANRGQFCALLPC